MTTWTCTFHPDGAMYMAITRKADRLGVSVAWILRMAMIEYLENNPKENEAEESKKYDMWRKGGE